MTIPPEERYAQLENQGKNCECSQVASASQPVSERFGNDVALGERVEPLDFPVHGRSEKCGADLRFDAHVQ